MVSSWALPHGLLVPLCTLMGHSVYLKLREIISKVGVLHQGWLGISHQLHASVLVSYCLIILAKNLVQKYFILLFSGL